MTQHSVLEPKNEFNEFTFNLRLQSASVQAEETREQLDIRLIVQECMIPGAQGGD